MNTQEEFMKHQYQIEDDEINLKVLLLKLKEYVHEMRKNWYILAFFCMPFTAYFLYKAFTTKPKYLAKLTFMVNQDETKSGGVAAILGQFGIGGAGESKDNLDRILVLSKARIIVEKAFFKKATVNGITDYYANHIIRLYEFHEKWEKDTTGLVGFIFKNGDSAKFSRTENRALKAIIAQIVGDDKAVGIFASNLDKKSGIMSLSLNSESEDLSIQLLEEIYMQLGQFYVDKTTEKQRRSYEIVEAKVDSIERALSGVEYRQADFDDRNRMILFEKAKLPKLQLNRDRSILTLMYSEAIKNLEFADFALKNKIPFIQSIDMPIAPIKPIKVSKIKAILFGISLGMFLGAIYIVGRKNIREALA
jgi:hypothetical protein